MKHTGQNKIMTAAFPITHSKVTFPLPLVSNCLMAVRTCSVVRSDPTVINKSYTREQLDDDTAQKPTQKNQMGISFFPAFQRMNKKNGLKKKNMRKDIRSSFGPFPQRMLCHTQRQDTLQLSYMETTDVQAPTAANNNLFKKQNISQHPKYVLEFHGRVARNIRQV